MTENEIASKINAQTCSSKPTEEVLYYLITSSEKENKFNYKSITNQGPPVSSPFRPATRSSVTKSVNLDSSFSVKTSSYNFSPLTTFTCQLSVIEFNPVSYC